ncbi:MAG TPA: hypothetical protein VH369_11110, partial [Bryobacteraceae bacterium]
MHLFVGSLHLLLAGFIFFDNGLQALAQYGKFILQLLDSFTLRPCRGAPIAIHRLYLRFLRFGLMLLEENQRESFMSTIESRPHPQNDRPLVTIKPDRNRLRVRYLILFARLLKQRSQLDSQLLPDQLKHTGGHL